VPLVYDGPPQGALRQGEVLYNVWEHRPLAPAVDIQPETTVPVQSLLHSIVVVMTADCDLEQDYRARNPASAPASMREKFAATPGRYYIPYVLLCECYDEDRRRAELPVSSRLWSDVQTNQRERYHHFKEAPVAQATVTVPTITLDFKRNFTVPTEELYRAIQAGGVTRAAIVPPIYVHDLMHRFYGFLSRVGVPD
jgi:hypothetical protein